MPSLALCMIVKNGGQTIRPCLESVAGLVDQIVIANTGCTDNTCEIAREFGATIVSFPWQDHFANARNAALDAATTDWVLVLDADEELDAAGRLCIPSLMTAPGVGGYRVPIVEYLPPQVDSAWTFTSLPNDSALARAKDAPTYMVNELCRLFRRRSDIYFTGRVHELVQPQIENAGLALELAPFSIHHFGHLADNDARARKRTFYHDLLVARLADDPTNVTTLSLCAMDEWEVHGRPLEALRYLERALQLMPGALEPLLLAAKVLCALGRYEDALVVLDGAGQDRKFAGFAYTIRGNACYALGRVEDARRAYATALDFTPGDRILQAKLDYLDVELGDVTPGDSDHAICRLQSAAVELPAVLAVHEYLVNAYIRTGRIAEAADEAERFAEVDPQEAILLKATALRGQLRQWSRVESLALDCLALFPASIEGRKLLMMSYIATSRLAEAASEADSLTHLEPEPGSFLRAASIRAQLGDVAAVKECVARGLVLFPDAEALHKIFDEMSRPVRDDTYREGSPPQRVQKAPSRPEGAQRRPVMGACT